MLPALTVALSDKGAGQPVPSGLLETPGPRLLQIWHLSPSVQPRPQRPRSLMQRPRWGWGEGFHWRPGSKRPRRGATGRASSWGDHVSLLQRLGRVGVDDQCEPRPTSWLLAPCSWSPSFQERRLHPHWTVPGWGPKPHTCGPPWRARAPSPVVEVRPLRTSKVCQLLAACVLSRSKKQLGGSWKSQTP